MSKLKKFGIFCVAIIGLILLLYAGENLRGKSAWENFKKEWEAKGEVFDYKQVLPKPVPLGKNFANTPLLKPLLEQEWNADFTESKPVDKKKTQRADGLMALEGKPPKLAQWRTGRATDLAAWQKFFRDLQDWPHPEKPGQPADDILFALKKHEADFAELTQAAQARPQCRFDVKYEATFFALLPHLSVLRSAARGYTLRALAHLANDDPDAALADVRMNLFLVNCIKDEPLLISHLVRIAMLELSLQPVWEGLAANRWKAAHLTALEQQLAGIDLMESHGLAMLGERDLANLMIEKMRDKPPAEWAELLGDGDEGLLKLSVIPNGWIYQNQVNLNRMHLQFSQRVVDTKTRRIKPQMAAAMEKSVNQMRGPYHLLPKLLLPAIGRVAMQTGSGQTAVDHARIACLLEMQKLEHKKYPAQLTGLKTPVPNDPYTGKPYVYKPDPKGRYQLYGVGWNQKDDGGKVVFASPKGNLDREMGDLVWQYSTVLPPKKNK
jgi:hypothetical protein